MFIQSSLSPSYEPRCEKTGFFAYAKTKMQISFAVTAKLISAFVFATRKVQSLHYLNPKYQASSNLLWLYSPVCVGPGRKPKRQVFSEQGSYPFLLQIHLFKACACQLHTINYTIFWKIFCLNLFPYLSMTRFQGLNTFSSDEEF